MVSRDDQLRAQAIAETNAALGRVSPEPEPDLLNAIGQQLFHAASPPWNEIVAAFSVAGRHVRGHAVVQGTDSVFLSIPDSLYSMVVRYRRQLASGPRGPWLSMRLLISSNGTLEPGFQYGENPLDSFLLLPPEAYREDLAEFPRPIAPWLSAHINQQSGRA